MNCARRSVAPALPAGALPAGAAKQTGTGSDDNRSGVVCARGVGIHHRSEHRHRRGKLSLQPDLWVHQTVKYIDDQVDQNKLKCKEQYLGLDDGIVTKTNTVDQQAP